MTTPLHYDSSAARKLIDAAHLTALEPKLLAARDEVFADISLMQGGAIPADKQPLDAGFIELPQNLLSEHQQSGPRSLLGQMLAAAAILREEVDRVVLLGIGGSYMGARALFEGLCHPYHNQLAADQRHGVPRVSFEGNNADNDTTAGLLELLADQCRDKSQRDQRWGLVVISKSGGTLETAVAFRVFRQALEEYYGADSDDSRNLVVPITGETGKLRNVSNAKGYPHVFPIPDGVGGRFSIFTAVGLFPAAVLGLDVAALLQGAADMTETFRTAAPGENPVLDYVALCQAFEQHKGMNIRVLSTWGARLEAAGLWYDQLLSESLGKHERGATPITVVNTRDLHSRGQQHQEGTRDKLITNVIVQEPSMSPVAVPAASNDDDQLNQHQGKTLPRILAAAIEGTNKAYADEQRPTADIVLAKLDEYALGQFFQMLMLATVLEGRLIGINPYGQPGVEAYKKNMTAALQR